MIAIDPQQEIFTALKLKLESKGYDVYDGFLPPENTPYPFVYLGNSTQTDTEKKNAVVGSVNQIVHVWHDSPKKRGDVSKMLLDVKTACREVEKTANFSWLVSSMYQNIFPDTTTKTPLLHGVVDVTFKFT